ncbi:MAG: hypothetical protein HYS41_06915 [Candidatus Omnitrophica bacterium]|nr:hypothetical protein [Candidatus Omnitrophota bacterium]
MKKWILALLVLVPAGGLYACPSCMEAIASQTDPAAVRLLRGYAWSVALMMAAPYLLFALITLGIIRRKRRLPLKRG